MSEATSKDAIKFRLRRFYETKRRNPSDLARYFKADACWTFRFLGIANVEEKIYEGEASLKSLFETLLPWKGTITIMEMLIYPQKGGKMYQAKVSGAETLSIRENPTVTTFKEMIVFELKAKDLYDISSIKTEYTNTDLTPKDQWVYHDGSSSDEEDAVRETFVDDSVEKRESISRHHYGPFQQAEFHPIATSQQVAGEGFFSSETLYSGLLPQEASYSQQQSFIGAQQQQLYYQFMCPPSSCSPHAHATNDHYYHPVDYRHDDQMFQVDLLPTTYQTAQTNPAQSTLDSPTRLDAAAQEFHPCKQQYDPEKLQTSQQRLDQNDQQAQQDHNQKQLQNRDVELSYQVTPSSQQQNQVKE